MPEFVQLPLPGTGTRIVVSCVWYGADQPAKLSATADAPSDDLSPSFECIELAGKFTLEELDTALSTLLHEIVKRVN